jgi:putative ABC transport system ATP-binding protein
MLPLQMNGVSSKEAKEKSLYRLQEVGLIDFINHRPSKMSGGQQQRVAIARALVNDPSLVIADEPTANLDSETARMIVSIMRDLNEKGATTFIFSTHDQRLLDRVKRLIRLEDGRIVDGSGPLTGVDASSGAQSIIAIDSSRGEREQLCSMSSNFIGHTREYWFAPWR